MGKLGLKIKILLVVLIVALISMIGGIYYISTKISPPEVRKIVLESIQKAFPGAQIELSELDYSVGLSLGLRFKSLKMHLPREKGELLNIQDASIKIPVWAIIVSGGTITLEVDGPNFFFTEYRDQENNWGIARGISKNGSEAEQKKESQMDIVADSKNGDDKEKRIKIVNFFANSQIDVKLTNIQFHYLLKDASHGDVQLSRFLVKNLNIKTQTAFELASKIDVTLSGEEKISLEAMIIGQLNIHEMILNQDIKSSILVKLENIFYSKYPQRLPSIKTDIKVTVKQQSGNMDISQSTLIENIGDIANDIHIEKDQMIASNINVNLLLKDLLSIFAPDVKGINADKGRFLLKGKFNVIAGKKDPNLEFSLTPAITYSLHPQMGLTTTAKGFFKGSGMHLDINNSLLGGVIDTAIATQIDLNRTDLADLSKMPLVNVEVTAKDIALSEQMIHETLYAPTSTNVENASGETNKADTTGGGEGEKVAKQKQMKKQETAPVQLPSVKLKILLERLSIGKERFSANSHIQMSGHQVASKETSFQFSDGQGKISFNHEFLSYGGSKTQFDFGLNKLNLSSLKPFLPKQLDLVTGTFTGKVRGDMSVQPPKEMTYNVDCFLDATHGELKGINLGPSIESVVENVPFLKGKIKNQDQKIDNNFEALTFKGIAKQNEYFIEKMLFWGVNKAIEIRGQGVLYPLIENKSGALDLEVVDHTGKLSSLLEKNTGSNILPIRLQGKGFTLKPDYGYTLGYLAKGAVKKNEEKVIKKAKETAKGVINKQLDKVIPAEKSQEVKKFLNGLLK